MNLNETYKLGDTICFLDNNEILQGHFTDLFAVSGSVVVDVGSRRDETILVTEFDILAPEEAGLTVDEILQRRGEANKETPWILPVKSETTEVLPMCDYYENGSCPACGNPVPEDAKEGQICHCGNHTFSRYCEVNE